MKTKLRILHMLACWHLKMMELELKLQKKLKNRKTFKKSVSRFWYHHKKFDAIHKKCDAIHEKLDSMIEQPSR